jgi:hypothetical protein
VTPDSAPTYREFADLKTALAELRRDVHSIDQRLEELHDDVKWLKRTMLGAIITLLGGMLLFLFTITAGLVG